MSNTTPPTSATTLPTSTTTLPTSITESSDPQRTTEARSALTAHLASIGNSHLQPLTALNSDIQTNSLSISKQEAQLSTNTEKLSKESQKHAKVAEEAGRRLKEFGDLQNWAEVLERDLLVLEETVERGEVGSGWVTEEEDEGEEGQGQEVNGGDGRNGKNEEEAHKTSQGE